MKGVTIRFIILIYISFTVLGVQAQSDASQVISKKQLGVLIDSIARVLEHNYISEEMGRKIGRFIKAKEQKGEYDNLSFQAFGKQITEDMVSVSNDVHMVAYHFVPKQLPRENLLADKLDRWGSLSNFGFTENKLLEDNIGYSRIKHFTKWKFLNEAKELASLSMQFFQNTDALIFDLRDNPGGFEAIVAYLASYFLDGESQMLQEYYCRYQNSTTNIHTTENVPGNKMPELPLFILVNEGTGSAAESFAYILKHLGRATLIGETTVGAGNGAAFFRISEEFAIQISVCETINAVTKTSWEQTGVVPHIQTTTEEAFPKALELAKVEGEKYRASLIASYEAVLNEMEEALMNYSLGSSDRRILESISQCQKVGLINESAINNMGYDRLRQEGQSHTAEAIFKANTLLFPNSANVYDSYADALSSNGKKALAIENFQKAVDLGRKYNDPSLNIYIENLKKAKKGN